MTASSSRPAGEPEGQGTRPALDQSHLSRMTLGDRRLECEVLEIFMRQSVLMLERIAGAEPAAATAAAHTLLGSARGIGAWRVARAAERVERAAAAQIETEVADAMAELKTASLEASAAIGSRLTVLLSELARSR